VEKRRIGARVPDFVDRDLYRKSSISKSGSGLGFGAAPWSQNSFFYFAIAMSRVARITALREMKNL
jgi:hypothetical protein